MPKVTGIALYCVIGALLLVWPQAGFGQACKDEESMVTDYEKSITDLTDTVKKESLPDFEKAYHQKNALTKLTLFTGIVEGEVSCLEKAETDSTATKEQVEEYKTKHEAFSKLKDRIQKDRDTLKSTEASKDAKALVAKLDYTK